MKTLSSTKNGGISMYKCVFFLLSLYLIAMCISTQSSDALYFGHDTIIGQKEPTIILNARQMMATEKGNVFVVWTDNKTIYFTSSHDSRAKFGPSVVLSDPNKLASSPQLYATEKGDVYVVWVDKNSTTGARNIIFRSSNDSGRHFDNSLILTGNKLLSFSPQLYATEKGDVYVVWVDKNSTTGDNTILFRKSNNSGADFDRRLYLDRGGHKLSSSLSPNENGTRFDETKKLRGIKLISSSPIISATEKGDVYVTWIELDNKTRDTRIVFRSSNDSGTHFDETKKLRGGYLSSSPEIASTEKGDVYVVWADRNSTNSTTGDSNILFRKSNNSAADFDRRLNLNMGGPKLSSSLSPQIAATEKGDVYVVWIDGYVKFREILNKDATAGEIVSLSNSSTLSFNPQIVATENGNIYVIWVDKKDNGDQNLVLKRISNVYFDRYK